MLGRLPLVLAGVVLAGTAARQPAAHLRGRSPHRHRHRGRHRLRATEDGDGSLVSYGCGISDSNQHLHDNLPILVAGGGGDRISGGRHLRFASDTPMTNLLLSLLDKLDVPMDQLGDSTGQLRELSELA